MQGKKGIMVAGGLVGVISVLLVYLGNPANMGFCIACFLRDMAGGMGLHAAGVVQYIRPEIIGLVLGAFLMAHKNGEFISKGGSSPVTRFSLGLVVMIGALMFLGCPLRMVLRLAGGDLNALFGLAGFMAGILVGIFFLNRGFSLKRNYKLTSMEGYIFPAFNLGLLVLLLLSFSPLLLSESGPGSMHAPLGWSLLAGLMVGAVAQRTRLCMVGGARDVVLFKDSYLLLGFLSILVFAFMANLWFGFFNLGFIDQPIAHTDGRWNFLGMVLVGWASVLLGGCPLRQLILSGEGNTDAVVTVLGLIAGAAICHNFGLASTPAGPTFYGKVASGLGFVFLALTSYANTKGLLNKGDV